MTVPAGELKTALSRSGSSSPRATSPRSPPFDFVPASEASDASFAKSSVFARAAI